MPSPRPRLLNLLAAVIITLWVGPSTARAELTFFASFDESPRAEFAIGNNRATARRGEALAGLTQSTQGHWSRALDVTASTDGRSLRYESDGNIDLSRGTIEFFAKLDPNKTGQTAHRYFTFPGNGGFTLSLGHRPRGQGLVLGYLFNGHHGWDYHSERFIGPGKWQHFAVTWDTTAGPKKGRLEVYVDGTRRLHTETLDPFRFGLESFYLGDRSGTNGWIDDFAISNDIRYTEDFKPPVASLKPMALAALVRRAKAPPRPTPRTLPNGHATLANGSFEKWGKGKPFGWTLAKGKVRLESTMTMKGRRALALFVDPNDPHPWPYSQIVSEPIALAPQTQYRLRLWVSIADTVGDLKFVLSGADDGELLTYSSGWTTEHPWLEVSEIFQTGDSRQYNLSIASQSAFGSPVWIDDISIEPVGSSRPRSSSPEKPDGPLRLFSRSIMETLNLSRRPPTASEFIDQLSIRMARGEFEPGLIGLQAPTRMKDVDISLEGDLVGPDQARLPGRDITIRRVNAGLLPLSRPRNVRGGEVIGWWVTARTRSGTPPGVYRGNLVVKSGSKRLRELPLEVEVLDVALPEPDIAFLMYHHENYFPEKFLTPQLQKAYYRDMRDHGMNTVTLYNNSDVDGTSNISFAKNYSYKPSNPRFQVGIETQIKWILESGLCQSGQPVLWLPSGHGYGWGGLPEPALKATLEQWKARKWPRPLLYVNDEPGGEGPRFDAALKRLKEIQSWNLPVRTTTAGLDPKILGQYYNVWIAGDAGVTVDALNQSRKLDAELWTYNCTCPHLNMPFSRAFYGFWAFRTEVRGVAQWAYYDNRQWTANEHGEAGGNPRTRLSRICPSPSGPIPTLSWEATREGIDDFRFAQLLKTLTGTAQVRLEELQKEANSLLSKKDRETIEARERQKIGQIKPKQVAIIWKPANANETLGEKSFLASRLLERSVQRARKALEFVINSIPYDAMSTRKFLSYHAPRWTRFSPPLGPAGLGENPLTATEVRRRILTSYILALQIALKPPAAK